MKVIQVMRNVKGILRLVIKLLENHIMARFIYLFFVITIVILRKIQQYILFYFEEIRKLSLNDLL